MISAPTVGMDCVNDFWVIIESVFIVEFYIIV
jgi:hypothetical protein